MKLTVVHLQQNNVSKESIELVCGMRLEKSIEQMLVGKNETGYIYFTKFGTVCFLGFSRSQIVSILRAIQIENADNYESHIYQDYEIIIDDTLDKNFKVSNNEVRIQKIDDGFLSIIAIVVSQSVGLERFEQLLDENMSKSRKLLNIQGRFLLFKRKNLLKFAVFLANIRQDMIVDLYLLDKPNITWDDEVAESLYNKLSDIFELKDRHTMVEYKLSLIRDNISFMMDAINHQNSEFLEWIIIILIAFEIGMSLFRAS